MTISFQRYSITAMAKQFLPVITRLSEIEYYKFIAICREKKCTPYGLLRELILKFVNKPENIEITKAHKNSSRPDWLKDV